MMMHFSECIPFAKQCMTAILILTYFGEKILILKKFRKVPTKYTYIKFIKLKVIRTQEQLMTQKIKIEHSRELQSKTGVGKRWVQISWFVRHSYAYPSAVSFSLADKAPCFFLFSFFFWSKTLYGCLVLQNRVLPQSREGEC